MDKLHRGAAIAVKECLGVRPGESVLVICDAPCRRIGELLWETAKEAGAEAMLLEMAPRKVNGEEPPRAVAEAMKSVDAVIAPTSRSLSHTAARREATAAGVRIATLPGITEEMLARTLNADYKKIKERSEKIAAILDRGREAKVMTQAGTNLFMLIEGRRGQPDTGDVTAKGAFSNLPAGEAYIAPVEGTASGTLVVDGGIGLLGNDPIIMEVEGGYVTKISGGEAAKRLEETIKELGKPARNIAELGVGTNDQAVLTGLVLEDEKVMGTVHIAIGNNASFGGNVTVPLHLDGILLKPTLEVDGQVIIRDGELLI